MSFIIDYTPLSIFTHWWKRYDFWFDYVKVEAGDKGVDNVSQKLQSTGISDGPVVTLGN